MRAYHTYNSIFSGDRSRVLNKTLTPCQWTLPRWTTLKHELNLVVVCFLLAAADISKFNRLFSLKIQSSFLRKITVSPALSHASSLNIGSLRARGQLQSKNKFIFYLQISRYSLVIYFITVKALTKLNLGYFSINLIYWSFHVVVLQRTGEF